VNTQSDTDLPPKRRRRGRRFARPDHVIAELAKVVAALWAGAPDGEPLDTRRANSLVYSLTSIAAVIRDEKLAEIEAQLEELKAAGVIK
jgi:hypothetical protein